MEQFLNFIFKVITFIKHLFLKTGHHPRFPIPPQKNAARMGGSKF
jgi:hypothetical protein